MTCPTSTLTLARDALSGLDAVAIAAKRHMLDRTVQKRLARFSLFQGARPEHARTLATARAALAQAPTAEALLARLRTAQEPA